MLDPSADHAYPFSVANDLPSFPHKDPHRRRFSPIGTGVGKGSGHVEPPPGRVEPLPGLSGSTIETSSVGVGEASMGVEGTSMGVRGASLGSCRRLPPPISAS